MTAGVPLLTLARVLSPRCRLATRFDQSRADGIAAAEADTEGVISRLLSEAVYITLNAGADGVCEQVSYITAFRRYRHRPTPVSRRINRAYLYH